VLTNPGENIGVEEAVLAEARERSSRMRTKSLVIRGSPGPLLRMISEK